MGDELNEALKAFLRIGVFIGGAGLVLLLAVKPETPEYVLSACSVAMGLVIIIGVVAVHRVMQ
jgi:preprotein translocase subunit Sss1